MSKYAFVLGRNPELSIAELGAVLGGNLKIPHHQAVVFFSGELPQTPQDFLNRLGGCVEILEIFESGVPSSEIEPAIFQFLKTRSENGKLLFAINLFPETKKTTLLKYILPKIKTALSRAMYLNKDYHNINPVAAFKENLVAAKTNIGIVEEGGGKVSLGYSVAMQDFESYSKRDYGKPFRDPQVGMLPPKLAQVMINLACHDEPVEARQISTVFDPFCGTGTILMEALLMGYSVVGNDVNVRLVEGTKKNIDWLRQMFPLSVPGQTHVQLFQKDAMELDTVIMSLSKHGGANKSGSHTLAVVTEPYLGPPLSSFPAENFLSKLRAELEKLYMDFFTNLSKWLPKGTAIVFIFPYWKKGSAQLRLAPPLIAKIEPLGYSKTTFVPLQITSLFYDRPDQIVGREIVRFVKT